MHNRTVKQLSGAQILARIICLGVVVLSIYKLIDSRDKVVSAAQHSVIGSNVHEATSDHLENVSLEQPSSISEEQPAETKITDYDVQSLKTWNEQSGYISQQDQSVYEGYSESVLESMVKAGDSRAAAALGYLHAKVGDFSKAKFYYWQAAALGETTSLGKLALLVEPASFTEMKIEERRGQIKEVMALLKLAELRGDLRISRVVGNGVKLKYEKNFGPLTFDEAETQQINTRASVLYSDLQQTRDGYGLGEFNNETPAIIKRDYSSQK
ncbi:MAG TPA: hypothetical protein VL995_10305 [Cellvibrio sp.]|nr:hypothetical protein [Cellvibrio sp.]